MTPITTPGMYDLPENVYHGDPVDGWSLSSSGAKQIMTEDPFHYWHRRTSPEDYEDTPALNFGRAAHMALLEPDRFKAAYHVLPKEFNGNATVKQADWHAERDAAIAAGKPVLSQADHARVLKMRASAERYAKLLGKIMTADKEQSGFWFDADFKIWRRMRLDFMPKAGRIFADYKTLASTNRKSGALTKDNIERAIDDYRWHCQAAWYIDGIKALGLCEDPIFLLIIQEKTPPFDMRIRVLDQDTINRGRWFNAKAMDIFAEQLDTHGQDKAWDNGDDYSAGIPEVGLNEWAFDRTDRAKDSGLFRLTYRMQAPIYMPEETAA